MRERFAPISIVERRSEPNRKRRVAGEEVGARALDQLLINKLVPHFRRQQESRPCRRDVGANILRILGMTCRHHPSIAKGGRGGLYRTGDIPRLVVCCSVVVCWRAGNGSWHRQGGGTELIATEGTPIGTSTLPYV